MWGGGVNQSKPHGLRLGIALNQQTKNKTKQKQWGMAKTGRSQSTHVHPVQPYYQLFYDPIFVMVD